MKIYIFLINFNQKKSKMSIQIQPSQEITKDEIIQRLIQDPKLLDEIVEEYSEKQMISKILEKSKTFELVYEEMFSHSDIIENIAKHVFSNISEKYFESFNDSNYEQRFETISKEIIPNLISSFENFIQVERSHLEKSFSDSLNSLYKEKLTQENSETLSQHVESATEDIQTPNEADLEDGDETEDDETINTNHQKLVSKKRKFDAPTNQNKKRFVRARKGDIIQVTNGPQKDKIFFCVHGNKKDINHETEKTMTEANRLCECGDAIITKLI